MSDSLAERLKKMAEKQSHSETAHEKVKAFQEQVNAYISEHARPEYDRLLAQLRTLVEQVNPSIGDLPKFQFSQMMGSQSIQQGNCVAFLYFDKPILNQPNNQLLLSFGPHPHNLYLDEPPPSIRYRLQAAASDALDGIVWVGDLGELTTPQLADFILEQLTNYYLEHKPGA